MRSRRGRFVLFTVAIVAASAVVGIVQAGAADSGSTAEVATAVAPSLTDARITYRTVGAGSVSLAGLAGDLGGGWIGWFADARPGLDRLCCENGRTHGTHGAAGSCRLADGSWGSHGPGQARWPVSDRLMVLVAVRDGRAEEARAYHQGCSVDAGGAAVTWLDDLDEARGLEFLAGLTGDHATGDHATGGLAAVAFHANPLATRVLLEAAREGRSEERRHGAIFWLGEARGEPGLEALDTLLQADPTADDREHLAFALSISDAAGAGTRLERLARLDPSPDVRSAALFWIAQRGGAEAAGILREALSDDPSSDVREQAVFAASQLADGAGTEFLLELVRGRYPLETKRRALFWLGQSDDPRALEEIRELLTRGG